MPETPCRVLLVDDDAQTRVEVMKLLGRKFDALDRLIEVEEADGMKLARERIEAARRAEQPFDVIVLDWRFEEYQNGEGLLRWVKERGLDTEVFLLTGNPEERLQERVLGLGAYFYADKKQVLQSDDMPPEGQFDEEAQLSGESFALMIANCVDRLRTRREQAKVIELIGQMHKDLNLFFNLDTQLGIVVRFPRKINAKIHKVSIRMRRHGDTHVGETVLERVACDPCSLCGEGRCGTAATRVVDGGIVAHVYKTGTPYVVNRAIAEDPYYIETCPKTRSEMGVPLKIGDRVIGVLNIESPEEDTFSQTVVEVMEAVAEAASPSIRNARHLEMVMRMAAEIGTTIKDGVAKGEGIDWNAAFDEAGADLVDALYKRVGNNALRLTDARLGLVYEANQKSGVLRLAWDRGMEPASKQKSQVLGFAAGSPRRGVCAEVARDGKTRRTTGDPEADRPLWEVYAPFLDDKDKIKSFLCVAIKLDERIFGVIDLEDEHPNKFTALDKEVLESFANMVAIALANGALAVSLKQKKEIEKSHERLRGRIDLYEMVAHESKKPLGMLETRLAAAKGFLTQGKSDDVAKEIETAQEMLLQTMRNFQVWIEAAKSEGENAGPLARFDLWAMLSDVADEFRLNSPAYRLELGRRPEAQAWAYASPTTVQLVLREIIRNAIEASDKEDGYVQISCRRDDRYVIISFQDNGPGIPKEIENHIFDRSFRNPKGHDRGLGLSRARSRIRLQLGDLYYVRVEAGARFELKLPADS